MEKELTAILLELGLLPESGDSPDHKTVAKERLLQLMASSDLDILGAIYTFIMDEKSARRVQPPLQFYDFHRFLLIYYQRCLRDDPKSVWADSRYSAGWDLANWFSKIWQENSAPRTAVHDLKSMIQDLYTSGDNELRQCIVTAILEHLFEEPGIRKYFEDWEGQPVLRPAYKQAMEWGVNHNRES